MLRKYKWLLILIPAGLILLLSGCPTGTLPAGGGGTDNTGGGGGNYTITWEVTGSYVDDPGEIEVSVVYSISSGSTQNTFDPSLPWSDSVTASQGDGVSFNVTGATGTINVTMTLYENGTVIDSENVGSQDFGIITHTVGM